MDMVGIYLLTEKTLLSKRNLWRVRKTYVHCRVDKTSVKLGKPLLSGENLIGSELNLKSESFGMKSTLKW